MLILKIGETLIEILVKNGMEQMIFEKCNTYIKMNYFSRRVGS